MPPVLSLTDAIKLEEAKKKVKDHLFVEAIQTCASLLYGAEPVFEWIQRSCDSWQASIQECMLKHEDERRSLMAQYMAAKERSEDLKKLKDDREAELYKERRRREEAEDQAAWLRKRTQNHDELLRENSRLKAQLQETRAQLSRARQQASVPKPPPRPSREMMVQNMAELECQPLRHCNGEMRAALKKKLLLKWHPDKQPSQDHAALATAVMQELQNRYEWEL